MSLNLNSSSLTLECMFVSVRPTVLHRVIVSTQVGYIINI